MEPKTDSEGVVYHWSPKKYVELVEHTDNPLLREYQQVELEYITSKIQSPAAKTFIDVGAGYGRVLPQIAKIASGVIAVEIDKEMLGELRKRAKGFGNAEVVEGDGNNLPDLLKDKDVVNPVVLSLQNSLGPWVGDWRQALSAMRKVAQDGKGEVVLSIFSQEGFRDKAIEMYKSAAGLLGEPDFKKIDYEKGVYATDHGYCTKWWTFDERVEMKQILGGQIVTEVTDNPAFYILHVSY